EIRFGDNDRLAARVAAMMRADTLVLLSDIDGLYARDPHLDPDAAFIAEVARITPEIEAMAEKAPPGHSSGGMVTKLAAARIATEAGCRMAIADGRQSRPLDTLARGARCTWFAAQGDARSAFKRWLGGALKTEGSLTVDDGALKALAAGRSLLPAGVVAVDGAFRRGDAVAIRAPDGREFGRGLAAYGADEARRIMGRNSRDIEAVLGYRGREELIHRDDMALTEDTTP
ncbi:MAG: glutamate 5-kinase, partial [Rhodospirillaceae bacterium]|nr:glutamate 5-kinase [Rhodospirillaceae bacterium]